MSNITPFNFNGSSIRTIEKDGEPWFVAKDVADLLGYKNAAEAIADHCKFPNKTKGSEMLGASSYGDGIDSGHSHNDLVRSWIIIPERDVYRLIMRSKLPEAEQFEEWVVGTVLPSIRKNGGYVANQEQLSPEEILAQGILMAQKVMKEKEALISAQTNQIEQLQPKAAFADQVSKAPDSVSLAQAAKLIGTGRTRFLAFLRKIGWVTRKNEPYQAKIEQGLLDVKLGSWSHPDHGLQQSVTALVTGKGLIKLQQLWSQDRSAA